MLCTNHKTQFLAYSKSHTSKSIAFFILQFYLFQEFGEKRNSMKSYAAMIIWSNNLEVSSWKHGKMKACAECAGSFLQVFLICFTKFKTTIMHTKRGESDKNCICSYIQVDFSIALRNLFRMHDVSGNFKRTLQIASLWLHRNQCVNSSMLHW